MEDIAPQLIAGIMAAYERCAKADSELQKLLNAILNGSRSYTDALDLGDRLGAALSEAFKAGLVEGVLPDDTMYFNIADRLVSAVASGAFDTAAAAAAAVQQRINEASGIGMKAVSAETKQGRLKDLINAVSGKDSEIARSTLAKAARQLPQGAVSDTMQANAEFQGKAGIEAKIVRRSTGKCCEWCDKAAGTYSYPDVPKDIYRRHDNCKCSVEYAPGKGGKRQTVHSGSEGKRRYVKDKYGDYGLTKEARVAHSKEMAATEEERGKVAREKRIETWQQKKLSAAQDGRQGVRDVVEKHTQAENVMPEYLRNATPGVGSVTYDNGYDMVRHAPEIKTAQWLHENLGGNIVLLNEIRGYKVMTPDYIWNNKLWDLKCVTTEKAANSAVRHGLKQIQGNSGGIILNYGENTISAQKLQDIINSRMRASATQPVDIIVLQRGKLTNALRYKK